MGARTPLPKSPCPSSAAQKLSSTQFLVTRHPSTRRPGCQLSRHRCAADPLRKVSGTPGGHQMHRPHRRKEDHGKESNGGPGSNAHSTVPALRCPKARARAQLPKSSFPPNSLPATNLVRGDQYPVTTPRCHPPP